MRRGTACLRQSAKRYHAPCRAPQTIERAGADLACFAFARLAVPAYLLVFGAGTLAALIRSNFSCAAAATRLVADSSEIERWLMMRS